MINEVVQQGKCKMTTNKTQEYLEKFQSFLYHNFKSRPDYNVTRPVSNQPAQFFAAAKTHEFDDYSLININDLK